MKILNACLKVSYFPKEWKRANVIVINKKGKKNDGNARSYRPISLLSNLGKNFEKLIMGRLNNLSNDKNWISDYQFGFSKNKSTVDAADNLVTMIEKNKKKKLFTLCIFFDIKGAFDNAWHPGIIKKLKEKECPSGLIKLIHSYLSDRTVAYENGNLHLLEKSCPQGGILSPFLWLININDILEININENCLIQAYADDICAIITAKNVSTLEKVANKIFESFDKWAVNNKLTFDTLKTEAVLFTNRHKTPYVNLVFGGDIIEVKDKVRYLGVILDRKLLWTEHVTCRINEAKKYSSRLLSAARMTWGLKPFALRKLYKSVIESTILYAAPVWIGALRKKNIQNMLQSAQRCSTLSISKSFRTAQNHVITALSGVLPIGLRAIELAVMRFVKKGRPPFWPDIVHPSFPLNRYSVDHSVFTDEIVAELLGVEFLMENYFSPFQLNRSVLKNALYNKWYVIFENYMSSWPVRFFKCKEDLICAQKLEPSYILTQFITGHSKLNYFLHRIGMTDSPTCECGCIENCEHVLYDCPFYVRQRFNMIFELREHNVSFPFDLSLIIGDKNVRNIVKKFLYNTNRFDV